MLQSFTIGQYYPGESFLHRMDPRPKLIFVFVYVIGVFMANNTASYVWMSAVLACVIALSRIPLSFLLRGAKPVWWMLGLIVVMHLMMTREGEVLFGWGPLALYSGGLRQALFVSVRLLLLIAISSLLTYTTRPMDLTDGLERLLQPLARWGAPTQEVALMMSVALRFIPTLIGEAEKIMKAQMARGADFESRNLIQRVKSLLTILVPLFVSAFERAEQLAMAMESRGYRGTSGRTRFRLLEMRRLDWWAVGMIVPVIVVLLGLRT